MTGAGDRPSTAKLIQHDVASVAFMKLDSDQTAQTAESP